METGTILTWYAAVCGVSSIVTFASFGLDKRAAKKGTRRISERTLHTMELLGGWPGALVGQRIFRHKTQKTSYRIAMWTIIGLHLAGLGWLLFR